MHTLRFRSGQVHLRKIPVESSTVIEAGDLLWLDNGAAKPASDFAWDTNLSTTQAAFAAQFLGVAHQPSLAGETLPISVDVSSESVYEFDVDSDDYVFGQPLGPSEDSSSLERQQLAAANAAAAIARAAEFSSDSVTRLRVTFASAYHTASSNTNAVLG